MIKNIIPIKQQHESGCGPTSLKMALEKLGIDISMEEIEKTCGNWKEEGMSNEELTQTAISLGLKVNPKYNSTWEELEEALTNDAAIIVSWMLNGYIGHFSVVNIIKGDVIELAEPESGKIVEMEKMVFLRLWFDYGDKWFPEVKEDFQLRWMLVLNK